MNNFLQIYPLSNSCDHRCKGGGDANPYHLLSESSLKSLPFDFIEIGYSKILQPISKPLLTFGHSGNKSKIGLISFVTTNAPCLSSSYFTSTYVVYH